MRFDEKRPSTNNANIKSLAMLVCSAMLTLLLLTGCNELTAVILSPNADSVTVTEGDTVNFQGAAVGGTPFGEETTTSPEASDSPYGFYWETGGNTLAEGSTNEKSIAVIFNDPGTFTISLTVVDKKQNEDTSSIQVFVKDQEGEEIEPLQAVVLSPISPITVAEGVTVTFKGEGIGGVPFTSEGDVEIEPYAYFWDTGGLVEKDSETEDFKEIKITFDEEGDFPIQFKIMDSRGVVDISTIEVTVIAEEEVESED